VGVVCSKSEGRRFADLSIARGATYPSESNLSPGHTVPFISAEVCVSYKSNSCVELAISSPAMPILSYSVASLEAAFGAASAAALSPTVALKVAGG
jgi:hypothetical protein